MREINPKDCGLIAAALEAYGQDHPDEATADRCDDLAELIATHDLMLTDNHPEPQKSKRGAMREELDQRARELEDERRRRWNPSHTVDRTPEETAGLRARLERLEQLDNDGPDRAE